MYDTHDLYRLIVHPDNLLAAWDRVRESRGAPGVDGVTVDDFDADLDAGLGELAAALQDGSYRPQPLLYRPLEKADGSERSLAIPTVRDRVAQRAAHLVLLPLLDPTFQPCSFAYRPGRSYQQALACVCDLRDAGFRWVANADIEACFDEVPHQPLTRRLRRWIADPAVLRLLYRWVAAPLAHDGRLYRRTRGLPQGAVISPLLANAYLDGFDRAVLRHGHHLVRFADDFVLLARSREEVLHALHHARAALDRLGLRLNPEKSTVTTFDRGFVFLGTHFEGDAALAVRHAGIVTPTAAPEPPFPVDFGRHPEREPLRRMQHTPAPMPAPMPTAAPEAAVARPPARRLRVARTLSPEPAPAQRRRHARGRRAGNPPVAPSTPPPPHGGDDPATPPSPGAPAPARPHHTAANTRRPLYVQHQGASLFLRHERFVLLAPGPSGEVLLDVPALKVGHVLVFGVCHVSAAVRHYCLTHDVPVTFLSAAGQYYGRLVAGHANLDLLRLQIARAEDESFRLDFSQSIVAAKLLNTKRLLQRRYHRTPDEALRAAIRQITKFVRRLPHAPSLDEVRGLEGAGAAAYFGVFGALLKTPGFTFTGRTRRPPTDPVNALLSFGYTLLFNHLHAFVLVHHLHPYLGLFHAESPGHPALVSDLMEEFRVVVDRLVLGLVNRRVLTPADFVTPGDERGCFLSDTARKTFIRAFERVMERTVRHPATGRPTTYRRCLDMQVQGLVRHLRGEAAYTPLQLR